MTAGRTGPALLAVLRDLLAETAALVAPRECACGREGTRLCPDCAALLARDPVRVDGCCDALQLLVAARLREDRSGPAGVDHAAVLPVLALGEYSEGLQALVLAWKNGGQAHLVTPLAAGLAEAVRRIAPATLGPESRTALVPVPSRRAAVVRRGENHTAELVRALARHGVGEPLMVRAEPDRGQEGHGARDRRRRRIRLRGRSGPSRKVVLVDDVVTTGSTLRGMAEALRGVGHEVLGAAVIASARVPDRPAPTLPAHARTVSSADSPPQHCDGHGTM